MVFPLARTRTLDCHPTTWLRGASLGRSYFSLSSLFNPFVTMSTAGVARHSTGIRLEIEKGLADLELACPSASKEGFTSDGTAFALTTAHLATRLHRRMQPGL